jgi:hypothetical protein
MYRFYSNAVDTNGVRVTIVGQLKNNILKLASARCSIKDNFCKKTGRSIAEGRLAKGKVYKEIPMESCNIETFVNEAKEAAIDISNNARRVIN